MPVLVASVAVATVMDYSKEMLAKEEIVAKREGYDIDIVRADMSKRFPFDDGMNFIFDEEETVPLFKLFFNPNKDTNY
jgi:hypothetical protein